MNLVWIPEPGSNLFHDSAPLQEGKRGPCFPEARPELMHMLCSSPRRRFSLSTDSWHCGSSFLSPALTAETVFWPSGILGKWGINGWIQATQKVWLEVSSPKRSCHVLGLLWLCIILMYKLHTSHTESPMNTWPSLSGFYGCSALTNPFRIPKILFIK